MTHAKSIKQVNAENYDSLKMLVRFLEVTHYYNVMDGLLRAQFAYPTVEFRHIISPSGILPDSKLPLDWSQTMVDAAMTMGYNDGLAALNTPSDAADTLKYFALKKSRDPRVHGVTFDQYRMMKNSGVFAEPEEAKDFFLQ